MIHVLLILSVLGLSLAQSGSPPDSPCPAVFRYSYSPSQGWHGIVSIVPPLTFSEVQLVLRLAVANYIPNAGVGKVEILGGDTEVQNIAKRASQSQRQTIQYLVVFPSYDQFPRISSVKINEKEFCSSSAHKDARGIIDLKYSLKTGLAGGLANDYIFSINGATNVQPQHQQQTQQQQSNRKYQKFQSPQQPQQPVEQWQQPQQPQQPVQQWQQPQQPQLPEQQWQQPQQPQQPVQQWQQPQQPQQPVQQWQQPQQPQKQWQQTTQSPQWQQPQQADTDATQPPTPPRVRATPRSTVPPIDEYPDDEPYDYTLEYQGILNHPVNEVDCGRPLVSAVNTLVIRGDDTRKGDWPWMAAMYLKSDKKFRCAGSLISRRHVVTAAHCVTDPMTRKALAASSLVIRLGRYDLDKEEADEQIMTVEKVLSHPSYTTSKKHDHDIGLLILDTAAVITNFVKPVCLWDDSVDIRFEALISKVGSAPGWGRDENGDLAKNMKLARMPVRTQGECQESDHDFFAAITSNKTFCAGHTNGTSLCNGDSGGGLFFKQEHPKTRKKAWFVRGIVSLSKPGIETWCGETNYVVFTDIAKVLKWIQPRLKAPMPSR